MSGDDTLSSSMRGKLGGRSGVFGLIRGFKFFLPHETFSPSVLHPHPVSFMFLLEHEMLTADPQECRRPVSGPCWMTIIATSTYSGDVYDHGHVE